MIRKVAYWTSTAIVAVMLLMKEWAYAGVAFAWVMAFMSPRLRGRTTAR